MMENLYCVSLAASVIALIFAWLQSKKVLAFSEGTPLMQKISRRHPHGRFCIPQPQYRTVAVFFAGRFVSALRHGGGRLCHWSCLRLCDPAAFSPAFPASSA